MDREEKLKHFRETHTYYWCNYKPISELEPEEVANIFYKYVKMKMLFQPIKIIGETYKYEGKPYPLTELSVPQWNAIMWRSISETPIPKNILEGPEIILNSMGKIQHTHHNTDQKEI